MTTDGSNAVVVRQPAFYPALTTALSIAGGLAGYQLAVSAHPAGIDEYLLALGIGLAVQVPILAVASHRRDRLASARQPGSALHLRLALCLRLATGLALGAALLFAWLQRAASGYLALLLAALALQLATHAQASWQQRHDLARFWRIQAAGAAARLLAVGGLVAAADLGYAGILLANLAAAATVWLAGGPSARRRRPIGLQRWRRALRRGAGRLLTVDGVLRSGKASYEALAINLTAQLAARWGGLSPAGAQAVLVSVGYLNALAVAVRQMGSAWESRATARPPAAVVASGLALLGLAALTAQQAWGVFDPVLPRGPAGLGLAIVAACAAHLAAWPLSRGYLFLDLDPPAAVRRVAARLLLVHPPVLLGTLGLLQVLGPSASPMRVAAVTAIATPIALALALRVRHA